MSNSPECKIHNIYYDADDTCPGCDAVDDERERIRNNLLAEYEEQLANMEWVLVNLDRVLEIVKNGSRQ